VVGLGTWVRDYRLGAGPVACQEKGATGPPTPIDSVQYRKQIANSSAK
jgi:hypothetical protein